MADDEGQPSHMDISKEDEGVDEEDASDKEDCSSEPMNADGLVQQDSGHHCPVGGNQCQPGGIQNALRPGYSERGHLVQQDTGTCSGRHSPVGGSQYQPEDIQVEAEIQAELLFIVFLLFLYTRIYI